MDITAFSLRVRVAFLCGNGEQSRGEKELVEVSWNIGCQSHAQRQCLGCCERNRSKANRNQVHRNFPFSEGLIKPCCRLKPNV
ncbi:hypothetical protein QR680_000325 [Steinernema hermaphroditum]|uniref:Uncharacterized protein n=1 Tax=Steinernema hermaphroditum TaxID=289476 RepID=A0AA39LE28_9BILA|nr:hypothetical protein QR680_000325 [Steinernema hermaphroditum]